MADRKKIFIPIAVLALGIFGTLILIASRPEVEKAPQLIAPPNVRVLKVQPRDIPVTVKSQGSVVPKTQANLVSEVAGRIDRVASSFEAGGFVREGQHLVWIDQRDYQVNLATQQAGLAQAQVLMERERAESEVARNEWDSLGRSGTPNALVLRQPQLQEALARVDAAEASVMRAKLDLERTIIRAPFTGRIRAKSVDRGGFVNRGTPIATLYSVDTAEIRLPVADGELAFLGGVDGLLDGDGPSVKLSADYAGGLRTWTGRIVRSEGEIDPETRMVNLIAAVTDPYGLANAVEAPLGVGLFVSAEIEGEPVRGAYLLPRRALRRDGQVIVVNDDRLQMRAVRVARSDAEQVIVVEGLNPGDLVVVSKLDVATAGMKVNPLPAEENPRFENDLTGAADVAFTPSDHDDGGEQAASEQEAVAETETQVVDQ